MLVLAGGWRMGAPLVGYFRDEGLSVDAQVLKIKRKIIMLHSRITAYITDRIKRGDVIWTKI
jgi:hypothetical protein